MSQGCHCKRGGLYVIDLIIISGRRRSLPERERRPSCRGLPPAVDPPAGNRRRRRVHPDGAQRESGVPISPPAVRISRRRIWKDGLDGRVSQ